jgi:hypothetical protein
VRRKKEIGNYPVGYCKPPRASQFKPGQSGNPRGRRRRNDSLIDIVRRVLSERVKIQASDEVRWITRGRAILQINFAKAMQNNNKNALHNILSFLETLPALREPDLSGSGLIVPVLPKGITDEEFVFLMNKAHTEGLRLKEQEEAKKRQAECQKKTTKDV